MKKISLPLIILIILIIAIIGEVLLYYNVHDLDSLQRIISAFGRLAALIILLKEGSLIKSKLFITLMVLLIITSVAGFLIKILHWAGADLMIMIGLSGISLVYIIHFLLKKAKKLTDYLKVIWLLSFSMGALFMILHWHYGYLLIQIQSIVFLILFAIFTARTIKIDRVNSHN